MKKVTLHNDIRLVSKFAKDGYIHIKYYNMEGKRKRFTTGMKDTKYNNSVIARQMNQLALEHYERNLPSDGKTIFSDIALLALRSTSENRSIDVQNDYENLLKTSIMPSLESFEIGKIKPMHIEEWKSKIIKKGISKSRWFKHWTCLRLIMQYFEKNEMIEKDPMRLVDRSSKLLIAPKERLYYTPKEVAKILEHSTGWFRAMIHTLFLTGMRTSEVIGLRWDMLSLEKNQIIVKYSAKKGKLKSTKTGKTRILDIPKLLSDELKIHYENRLSDTYVFPSYKTLKPYHGTNAISRHYFQPLLKELGIEYKTLYATRHSFASNLIQNNVPITYVQRMLGHSKPSTTFDSYVKGSLLDSDDIVPHLENLYKTA